ncbi:AP-1 complex subunit mu-1 [Galdieria sulphuraria]|nr:AP-1 complex subunit mu-1 [Galdieria sulphuraria]
MVVSALYILDARGRVLISRNYRGDVPVDVISQVKLKVIEAEDDSSTKPILHDEQRGYSLAFIKVADIFLVAVTRTNANAALMLSFLYRVVLVFREYFKDVEEESIRDNFVLIYELLDEMMDFGFPQSTESKVLQEYITQERHVLESPRPPIAVTNAVSWRSEGVKHQRNEVFLDVIEKVNLLVGANGNLLYSEILGQMKMKSYLSGMPELKLGLNDKLQFEATGRPGQGRAVELEDIKFHQCVRLSRFETDRTISFIPPDGEFELMSYRLSTPMRPLIWVDAMIEFHPYRVNYTINVRAQFKPKYTANSVKIHIPTPPDADTPSFKSASGRVKYTPEKDVVVWSLKHLHGGQELVVRGYFGLPSIPSSENREQAVRRPISVEFEIPYFTVSGLQVRYLKIIEKSGYRALPWVRYITQNGDYQLRMA